MISFDPHAKCTRDSWSGFPLGFGRSLLAISLTYPALCKYPSLSDCCVWKERHMRRASLFQQRWPPAETDPIPFGRGSFDASPTHIQNPYSTRVVRTQCPRITLYRQWMSYLLMCALLAETRPIGSGQLSQHKRSLRRPTLFASGANNSSTGWVGIRGYFLVSSYYDHFCCIFLLQIMLLFIFIDRV